MRITLDTNVWSRLAERDEVSKFEAFEDSRKLRVVIPPSTLLEALRTEDSALRDRIIHAIVSRPQRRTHLRSEARLEADELVAAMRAMRPAWLRQRPDLGSLDGLDKFWSRRIYQVARDNPESLRIRDDSGSVSDTVERTQRSWQEAVRTNGIDVTQREPWALLEDSEEELRLGWDGTRVMAWRVLSAQLWWWQITRRPLQRVVRDGISFRFDTTYFDWVSPYVEVDRIASDHAAWNRFWYHDVEQSSVPRAWIRALFPFAQIAWKLGSGEPRDAQHAAYLFDTDVFVTADKRYAWAIELLRKWAKTPFAEVAFVTVPPPVTESFVDRIDEALS